MNHPHWHTSPAAFIEPLGSCRLHYAGTRTRRIHREFRARAFVCPGTGICLCRNREERA